MKQVNEVFKLKVGEKREWGNATLSCIQIDYEPIDLAFMNMRSRRNTGTSLFNIANGEYVRLQIDGELFMSDTPMELNSNSGIIEKANGSVLIGGLGIGLLLLNLQEKLNDGTITEIVVVENNKDVIDLVGPYYKNPKIKIHHADIFDLVEDPAFKGRKFDTIYLDIWASLNEDVYEEMKVLQRAFKRRFLNKENPDCYINCWMKDFLASRKKKGML